MVVWRLNKPEFRTAAVPARFMRAPPLHIEDLSETVESLSDKIESGEAFLKVVAYPWGVEFDVCDSGVTRA